MSDGPIVVQRRRASVEVYATPGTPLGEPDRVIALDAHLAATVGRAPVCEVQVSSTTLARRHAVLHFEGDGWHVEDLGSTNGTWLRGERVQRGRVGDGEVLELGAVRLRLRESVVEEPRHPVLVERICEAPDDDARWQVYADWMLEAGLPLGPRAPGEALDEACLERIAFAVRGGALRLSWRHGLVEAAELTLRPGADLGAARVEGVLSGLADLPVASTLQRLVARVTGAVVEFPTARPVFEQLRARFAAVRDGLARGGRWPALSSLKVGPVWGQAEEGELAAALSGLQAACPRLPGPARAWLLAYGEAWLDVERPWRGPGPGEHVRGRLPLESRTLQLGGLVFRLVAAGWHVMGAPGAQVPWSVNGVPGGFMGTTLLPGDELRQGDDFLARFGAAAVER